MLASASEIAAAEPASASATASVSSAPSPIAATDGRGGIGTGADSAAPILLRLMVVHGLVDAFGATIQPLWPDIQLRLSLSDAAIQGAFLVWTMATSVSQLGFGLWGDRASGRWLIWAGPAMGVVGLSLVGLSGSLPTLCLALLLGGLGIAAFHPEAAVVAGSCSPSNRSRAMSLFLVGGFLGQALGPLYAGLLTTRFGIPALAIGLVWGLPVVAIVAMGLMPRIAASDRAESKAALAATAAAQARDTLAGPSPAFSGEVLRRLAVILSIGVFRVIPSMGVPVALAFLLKARGASNDAISLPQSLFLGGIGAGSLFCATLIRQDREHVLMWSVPLAVIPFLLGTPVLGTIGLWACVAASGFLLGMTQPLLVSYGQRLVPRSQRLASSITMGVTWGIGGIVVAAVMGGLNHLGRPELAFAFFGVSSLLSSLSCIGLPRSDAAPPARSAVDASSSSEAPTATVPKP
jgi:FSR family fosmidomycin resistance protein-like MFS transporter